MLNRYFEDEVYPVLTPMAVDSSRPFPLIRNKSLNIGALVRKKGERKGMRSSLLPYRFLPFCRVSYSFRRRLVKRARRRQLSYWKK